MPAPTDNFGMHCHRTPAKPAKGPARQSAGRWTITFRHRQRLVVPVRIALDCVLNNLVQEMRPDRDSLRILKQLVFMAIIANLLATFPGHCTEAPVLVPPSSTRQNLLTQFQREIYPLLAHESNRQESCISCHDADSTSNLVFLGQPEDDFEMLLENGYFASQGPDTLLARVTAENVKKRMPKGNWTEPWRTNDVERLRSFLHDLNSSPEVGGKVDEGFPTSLLRPYKGPTPATFDSQFVTYRQLRGKIKAIFEDDWFRAGKDLFQENVAQFGGADFKERFNESSQPTSAFLSALETLAKDVSSQAYARKLGPFAWHPATLSSLENLDTPDKDSRAAIANLYDAILFRAPTSAEEQEAFTLLKNIHADRQTIQSSDYELGFELTITDPATGLRSQRSIAIPVSGSANGLYQELIDQSASESDGESTGLAKKRLAKPLRFAAEDTSSRLVVHNVQTFGNVSFAGIELQKSDSDEAVRVEAKDSAVRAEGAWKIKQDRDFLSYEDEGLEKGNSSISVPVRVSETAEYAVTVLWRANSKNAANVLVEVFYEGATEIAQPALAAVPEAGEARFVYDSAEDTTAYADLGASFLFDEDDYLEINNSGTRNRVTASAVNFVPTSGDGAFMVDSKAAEGSDQWTKFDAGQFGAYNLKGTPLQDENKNKGERFLRFRPSNRKDAEKPWQSNQWYQARIHYPGKNGNESRVPVIVKAQRSSPIIQLTCPARTRAEATVQIDASASYTVQQSALEFSWKQTKGLPAALGSAGSVLRFIAPRRTAEQAAWEALSRALVRHPDFLFTRPPSLLRAQNAVEKRRLQLMKIALDLVGRAPTRAERQQLDEGTSLEKMIDRYLESQEFRDFYFHRIRLYLESHGTEIQDEPARLWCHVAFNDLPFQEILTADYTVDAEFKKQPRPSYHGRTGVLTTKGFIEGKPGLPHYNYAAQVSMLFLGYIYEVPPEIVEQREGITALGTTDPNSVCYNCHKILTPLALQRNFWSDDGQFRARDDKGLDIDATDQRLVAEYPFKGEGMEAFATQAVKKERFIRTMINAHFHFYFGRPMRYRTDERTLYKNLWDQVRAQGFAIRSLIRGIMNSSEYLEGRSTVVKAPTAISNP